LEAKYQSRDIRWLLLSIMHEARKAGKAQRGGWLNQLMLQEILSVQGYDLTAEEMKDELEYLIDKGCAAKERIDTRMNKYRILATGIDALNGEIKIPGIGIIAGK